MKKKIWEAAVSLLLILSLTLNTALLFLCMDLKKQNELLRTDVSSIPSRLTTASSSPSAG